VNTLLGALQRSGAGSSTYWYARHLRLPPGVLTPLLPPLMPDSKADKVRAALEKEAART
jgi:hypothetical protein